MRAALVAIVDALVTRSHDGGSVTLDEIGDALGTEVASADDVDAILAALEARGRVVVSPPAGDVQGRLRAVLAAARAIGARAGRKATTAEIAQETGLAESSVRAALMLGRVMGR